jgi:spore maturation protein CgeB
MTITVRADRRRYEKSMSYNNDDPFGLRDGRRWRNYLAAVAEYDVLVVMRDINVTEARSAGARMVVRIFMSLDEIAHVARPLSAEDWAKWSSDVAFIGTWLPERGPFMLELAQRDVPITIYGDRWHKAPEWPELKRFWRGPGIYAADDYAKSIQCAKIGLGLISKGNRDLHTHRSFEIPSLGSLLLAERTCEHQTLTKKARKLCSGRTRRNAPPNARSCLPTMSSGSRLLQQVMRVASPMGTRTSAPSGRY